MTVALTISAVSAESTNATDDNAVLSDVNQDTLASLDAANDDLAASAVENEDASFGKVSKTTYMKGDNFNVKLLDDNKSPLADKTVKFTFNGKTVDALTNNDGNAALKLNVAKGTYDVKYSFSEEGFNPITGSSKILVITNKTSNIVADPLVAYSTGNVFYATLTVDGLPLAGRTVDFTINGKTYSKTTNSKGVAGLDIGLWKGNYPIVVSYAGETNIEKSSVSSSILVINSKASKIVADPLVAYSTGNVFYATLTVDGLPLAGRTVDFTVNGKTYSKTTNSKGVAGLDIGLKKGSYPIVVSYAGEKNINKASVSSSILVVSTKTSKIVAPEYTAYVNFKNTFTATLTVDGLPLAGRTVDFTINGKTYSKTTDSKGVASLDIGLYKGNYPIVVSYAGEKNVNKASVSSKITVLAKMPMVITGVSTGDYKANTPGQFKVKLTNARGTLFKGFAVKFTINGKTYDKKTDNNGIATLDINLNPGSYSMKVSASGNSYYESVSKTFSFKVQSAKNTPNDGFWLFGRDMKSVNLDTLKNYGTKHIFLNFKAVELYGKSGVESFIKSANSKGINVHIWMQVFYDGEWLNPVKNGQIDYNLINSKISEAKSYANIKGVSGIHMDYLRYPGTAYKYAKSTDAINYFTQQVCKELHSINSKLIVSAAIMPEPSSDVYYYGQDIPTLTKYLDAIVPMIYKGNYNQGTSWIKKTTETFVKQSSGAEVWVGLQSYRSDSNPTSLPASELLNDGISASNGGATGVILFRWGLTNYVNFNKF
ncbi:putative glycoside hydrolase [Methanobrevibacter sp.]|uniref:putative glycoside hydrolase n=1 Tax=Methanobrevibacter sp. TaxID=66852 RepID=UPI00388F6C31